MLLDLRNHLHFKSLRWVIPAAFLVLLAFPATLRAQSEDFDDYKIRLETFWFYSNPSGTIQGQGDTVAIDLVKDLNFNTYSTFAGKVDWKFTPKNHFYIAFSPFRHDAANGTYHRFSRTDLCGGFDSAERSPFLSGRAQLSIRHHQAETWASRAECTVQSFRYNSKNKRGPQVINGQQHAAVSASNTLVRYLTDSPRVFVEGNVYGMYFFGYGSFVSTADTMGVMLTKHISVNAGYQLGPHLVVTNQTNRFGIHLTEKGALAGLEFSF